MLNFLAGGGSMADAIIAHDWSASPIGAPETWPAALKTSVALILNSRFPGCVIWGPSLTTIPNDAFLPILGHKPAALGRSFADVWAEVWDEIGPIADRALAGEATFIEDYPLVIDRGSGDEEAWFTFCYSPIRDEHGVIQGFLDTVMETSATVVAARRMRMLNGELGHRLKNVLALAQSISVQTLRRTPDPALAAERVGERLQALGVAADLLTGDRFGATDLLGVAKAALDAHDGRERDRIGISGPPLAVGTDAGMALSLALHELATNAVKYGALSHPAGRVDLSWQVMTGDEGEDRLRLEWREYDGPAVAPPTRRGFGSSLIERALGSAFGGTASMIFRPEGLVLTLDAPLPETPAL